MISHVEFYLIFLRTNQMHLSLSRLERSWLRSGQGKLKVLRTDNGMKFCSSDFKSFCRKEGIVRHHTIPHTPYQNDVAECMNRTVISKAHCMLSNLGMSRKFWAEAASTACHLINCSPSTTITKKTPIEVWFGSPYDYSQLRVFLLYCICTC
jgi:transposase InsO family protein